MSNDVSFAELKLQAQRQYEAVKAREKVKVEQVKRRYEITENGVIDRETGENVAPDVRPTGDSEKDYELLMKTGSTSCSVLRNILYRCGDTGKFKRVGLYVEACPPERFPDETDFMSLREFLSPSPEPREPFDRDFLAWWCDHDGDTVDGHIARKSVPPDVASLKAEMDSGRFRQSLSRARGMVQQYADSNEWEYFVTLTLDRNKQDRQNLALFIPKFKKLMENTKRATGQLPQYVTVPELHRDNISWHLHGLMNIPASELVEITDVYRVLRNGHYQWHMQDGSPIGYDTAKKFLKGNYRLFRWPRYEKRFGFCTVEAIQNKDSAAAYCNKMFRYISETMKDDSGKSGKKHKAAWKILAKGKHLYYCSRGLKKYEKIMPEEVAENLSGAGLKAGKLYRYPYCEIQFYYIDNPKKSQGVSENNS